MAEIKTALEIALERTRDIKGDRTSLEAKEYRERGLKLLARAEAEPELDIKKELSSYKGQQLSWVHEGLRQNLLGVLALPSGPEALDRLAALAKVFVALSVKPKDMQQLLNDAGEFFKKYLEDRDHLFEAVLRQYEPALRQKEEAMARQTGRHVRINPEQDPEYNAFLKKNLDGLTTQYQAVVDKLKQEVESRLAD